MESFSKKADSCSDIVVIQHSLNYVTQSHTALVYERIITPNHSILNLSNYLKTCAITNMAFGNRHPPCHNFLTKRTVIRHYGHEYDHHYVPIDKACALRAVYAHGNG